MGKNGQSRLISSTDRITYSLLIWPSFLILFLLTIVPLALLIGISVSDLVISKLDSMSFIGLKNYIDAFRSVKFWKSIGISGIQVGGIVSLQMLFGLLIALLLGREFRLVRASRLLFMIPMMIAHIVVGYTWRMLFNTELGMINYFLSVIGLPAVNWLSQPVSANIAVIVGSVWVSTPQVAIILLAGIQSISMDYYESARVDGASAIRQFFTITLPLLKPTIFTALLFRVMDAIRSFDTIYAMTAGGPGNATETLNVFAYSQAFKNWRLGYGAAVSMIMLVLIIGLSSGILRSINRTESY